MEKNFTKIIVVIVAAAVCSTTAMQWRLTKTSAVTVSTLSKLVTQFDKIVLRIEANEKLDVAHTTKIDRAVKDIERLQKPDGDK